MQRMRKRNAARDLIYGKRENPAVRRRYLQAYRLSRYGLTQELYDQLLTAQQNACAMCGTQFGDGQPVFIDHDHACCPDEKTSCGECVRGLLDLSCNTALGHIERRYELARAYLDNPPGRLVMRARHAA
jgi:Recombination endonuclease VII